MSPRVPSSSLTTLESKKIGNIYLDGEYIYTNTKYKATYKDGYFHLKALEELKSENLNEDQIALMVILEDGFRTKVSSFDFTIVDGRFRIDVAKADGLNFPPSPLDLACVSASPKGGTPRETKYQFPEVFQLGQRYFVDYFTKKVEKFSPVSEKQTLNSEIELRPVARDTAVQELVKYLSALDRRVLTVFELVEDTKTFYGVGWRQVMDKVSPARLQRDGFLANPNLSPTMSAEGDGPSQGKIFPW